MDEWVLSGDVVRAELTLEDLLVIHYAVRELRAGTEEWEFPTLVGASVQEADALAEQVRRALDLFA